MGQPMPLLSDFHPLISTWFQEKFQGATDPQLRGWPEIRTGQDVLISAPTGSGKTLAAFLSNGVRFVKFHVKDIDRTPRRYFTEVGPRHHPFQAHFQPRRASGREALLRRAGRDSRLSLRQCQGRIRIPPHA